MLKSLYDMGMSLETATTEWLYTLFAGCVSDMDSLLVWDLFFIFGPYSILKIAAECLSISLGLINKYPSERSYSEVTFHKKKTRLNNDSWELVASEGSKGLKEKAKTVNIRHIWINTFQEDMLMSEEYIEFLNKMCSQDEYT